jgi:hypothetical protein
MTKFILSDETHAKVTALMAAMDKLDEIRESLGKVFGDDDLAMEMLCELGSMVDEMSYLNEVLHEKEFEGKMLNA